MITEVQIEKDNWGDVPCNENIPSNNNFVVYSNNDEVIDKLKGIPHTNIVVHSYYDLVVNNRDDFKDLYLMDIYLNVFNGVSGVDCSMEDQDIIDEDY